MFIIQGLVINQSCSLFTWPCRIRSRNVSTMIWNPHVTSFPGAIEMILPLISPRSWTVRCTYEDVTINSTDSVWSLRLRIYRSCNQDKQTRIVGEFAMEKWPISSSWMKTFNTLSFKSVWFWSRMVKLSGILFKTKQAEMEHLTRLEK